MDKPSWYPRGDLKEPFLPVDISDSTLAFPGTVSYLMPPIEAIPDEYDGFSFGNKEAKKGTPEYWRDFQNEWFMRGLDTSQIKPKPGIDRHTALRHLNAIQGSYEPKHEYKSAAVAYLASLWFDAWK